MPIMVGGGSRMRVMMGGESAEPTTCKQGDMESMRMKLLPLAVLAILAVAPVAFAQQTLTPELLWELPRVGGPVVSPDGTQAVFTVTTYDIGANKGNTNLYLIAVEGGEPRQLTDFEGSESSAQWRPDGAKIGFLSSKGGSLQLWEIDPDGTNLRQVSNIEDGIANFRYSPTGTHVSFTHDIKLDKMPNEVYPDLPEADARIIDGLMFRHWNSWHDYSYSHLFVAEYDDGELGDPVDVMPFERFDTPLSPFGGVEQIGWGVDGESIAYTAKKKNGTAYAVSTDSAIYLYEIDSRETANLTEGMVGYDIEPIFSPDGRYLAWLSMERDGYEADRNRLFVYDFTSEGPRELTVGFDGDAHGPAWSGDSSAIYFSSETVGTVQLFSVDVASGGIRQITDGVYNYGAFGVADTESGTALIASRVSMSAPAEIYSIDVSSGEAERLTFFTQPLIDDLDLGKVEKRMVRSTDGAEILTWVIYPPGFDPSKRYPALLYAQGGPQSTVSQFFSYRWNFQLMAAGGYIVVAPNRRGVPSFGQTFKEEISGDYGGQAMRDLLSAIDEVAAEPYVDEDRLGAVGASFGGYTTYFLAGHHEGRFKTFITHAGLFNLESFFGATEEIFFVNFDLEGPYWQSPKPESYEAFSPHNYVQNWDTPMLIIHGQKDFRVPVTEGMQAFTALQLKGIESRLLYYPEEGHWITSPQNGLLWHRVFFDWLERYLQP